MKRTPLTLMLIGFSAAFLISALALLEWLAVLRGFVADQAAHDLLPVGLHINTGRYLFVIFLFSFSAGTLLIRWRFWKRRLLQQLP